MTEHLGKNIFHEKGIVHFLISLFLLSGSYKYMYSRHMQISTTKPMLPILLPVNLCQKLIEIVKKLSESYCLSSPIWIRSENGTLFEAMSSITIYENKLLYVQPTKTKTKYIRSNSATLK